MSLSSSRVSHAAASGGKNVGSGTASFHERSFSSSSVENLLMARWCEAERGDGGEARIWDDAAGRERDSRHEQARKLLRRAR